MMNASPLPCPNCGASMARRSEPDLKYEECPKCGGLFLDQGELNQLATGLSGDIEFCSVDANLGLADRFPARACPRCRETMKKEVLLFYTDVIFDHCRKCGGWFLDRAELGEMNRFLNKLRESQGGTQDSRTRKGDHWVTVTRITEVQPTGGGIGPTLGVPVLWTRISVFLRRPLPRGLRIKPETWAKRFWKLFGSPDAKVGDADFDKAFVVTAEDPASVKSALTGPGRKALLEFLRSPPARLGYKRAWEVLEDRIVFSFTDWGRETHRVSDADQDRLTDALTKVADALGA